MKPEASHSIAFGAIASPAGITLDQLGAWFRKKDIVATYHEIDSGELRFCVAVDENSKVATADGTAIDYVLTLSHVATTLAQYFSADVIIGDVLEHFADWSSEDEDNPVEESFSYVVSLTKPDVALFVAKLLSRDVTYATFGKWSLWKMTGRYNWTDTASLSIKYPLYIFENSTVYVQYKAGRPPVDVRRWFRVYVSYDEQELDNDLLELTKDLFFYSFDTSMRELIGHGLSLDTVHKLITVANEAEIDADFVKQVVQILQLPDKIAGHINEGTMPEEVKTEKSASWWGVLSRSVEARYYEADAESGKLKRILVAINRRPVLAWTWIVGQLALGCVIMYSCWVLPNTLVWWQVALGFVGAYLVFETLLDAIMRVDRYRKRSRGRH